MSIVNIFASQLDKPNRITTTDKDEKYHVQYGKFCTMSVANSNHGEYINKIKINKSFYKGQDGQWVFPEDVEAFLKDDTNTARNRIKVVNNTIRPLVEQFRGNANRLGLNATAHSISERISTRREQALSEQLFYFDLSQELPSFADMLKNKKGIADSREETEQIFHNMYVDKYVSTMNKLLRYVANYNEFFNMQIKVAENLALTGLCVAEGYEYSGQMKFDIVESEEFFFDNSCKRYDLGDAEYMGRASFMNPTDVYERYQPKEHQAEAIERYVRLYSGNIGSTRANNKNFSNVFGSMTSNGPKVPVFKTYWRDVEKTDWGYVMSEYGYKKMVRINYTREGMDGPDYTDADLVEAPQTAKNDKVFGGKLKRELYTDSIRYCIFIPSDILASVETYSSKKEQVADVVLEYGLLPYQEVENQNPSNVKFPFKCYTWAYVDGEILSPVDDAISPQRLINRVLSVAESQLNTSGGTNVIIDEDTIDAQDPDAIDRDMKQGKPIRIRTKGVGVPNSVGYYDTTPKGGTYEMFKMIPIMRDLIQSSTGVNEPLQGQSIGTGNDQLVGVTNALIERGSLMQEPFYKAVEMIFTQMYQMTATVGKRIYVDNESNLIVAVGQDDAEVLTLSRDYLNEDFRVFIRRSNTEEVLRSQANVLLGQLLQMQMLDDIAFANLYDRSTPDDVTRAMRQFAAVKIEANKKMAQQQQQQMEQQQVAQDASVIMNQNVMQQQQQQQGEQFQQKLASDENKEILKTIAAKQKSQPIIK